MLQHWLLVRGSAERLLPDEVDAARLRAHSSTRRPSVQKGDLVAPGHKILKGRMHFFDAADPKDYVKFGTEKATAAADDSAPSHRLRQKAETNSG